MLKKWDDLPEFMKTDDVKVYYDILYKKRYQLVLKRVFDVVVSLIMLLILFVPMVIIAIVIKIDSPGPVFYRQERVTRYGKRFRIHKFRTMVNNADKIGTAVTIGNDSRITRVGSKIRDCRLDELPQLIDVLIGDMSFVGTRPEATKYVAQYTSEMNATLLMPAGITSEASVKFKDEAMLLSGVKDVDYAYVEKILPMKMKYNIESLAKCSVLYDIKIMFETALEVI